MDNNVIINKYMSFFICQTRNTFKEIALKKQKEKYATYNESLHKKIINKNYRKIFF